MNSLKKIIVLLLIILIALTGYNLHTIGLSDGDNGACLVDGDTSSCSDVQNSEYGTFLGIKVALLGFIAFIVLFGLYILANTKNNFRKNAYQTYLTGTITGTIISLYFISLQLFVLEQICSNCMVIDITMLIVATLTFLDHKRK